MGRGCVSQHAMGQGVSASGSWGCLPLGPEDVHPLGRHPWTHSLDTLPGHTPSPWAETPQDTHTHTGHTPWTHTHPLGRHLHWTQTLARQTPSGHTHTPPRRHPVEMTIEAGGMHPTGMHFCQVFITASKRSLQRLCFHRCLSVHGRCLLHCMLGYTPESRHAPEQTPLQE